MTLLVPRGPGFLGPEFPLPLDRPFTTAQARGEGLRAPVLARLCDEGLLRRPVRGTYLATQAGDSPLLRAQALALVVPDDAVICDRHAGWLHGADMVLAPNEHLELSRVSVFRPSDHGRVKSPLATGGERNLRPEDVTEVHGLPVTTALRTAWDLGRVRSLDHAIAGMDALLRLGRFSRARLNAGVPRFAGMRWVTTLRAIAPLADGRAESPPESILRLRCLQAGIPDLQPQFEVREGGRLIAKIDLGDDALRLAVEYDGHGFHSSEEQTEHDRRRRKLLRERYEWLIVVVRRENLFGPRQDVEQLLWRGVLEARRRAGARIVMPTW